MAPTIIVFAWQTRNIFQDKKIPRTLFHISNNQLIERLCDPLKNTSIHRVFSHLRHINHPLFQCKDPRWESVGMKPDLEMGKGQKLYICAFMTNVCVGCRGLPSFLNVLLLIPLSKQRNKKENICSDSGRDSKPQASSKCIWWLF